MNGWQMLFEFLGGIGLFIFGMNTMGTGLNKVAGSRMKTLLGTFTNNRILGVITGALVTAIIQSSSATTVLVVGFVNAGIMSLRQAVGVILGANIGTTITAQIIAFKLEDYAMPAIGIGVFCVLFLKSRKQKDLGSIILGFGLLFLGMTVMKDAMAPLESSEAFVNFTQQFSTNPILGVFIGFALTGIVQSSSATIGILQNLVSLHLVSLQSALPILFGDNIGTCVTAMLSGIGASVNARRAAFIHLLFNLLGTVIFLLLMPLILPVVEMTSADPVRQVANAHTMFNIANTLIQLPFVGLLAAIAIKVIPDRKRKDDITQGTNNLDKRLLANPDIAMSQARNEVYQMGLLCISSVEDAKKAFLQNDEKSVLLSYKKEKRIDELNHYINDFLGALAAKQLTETQVKAMTDLLNATHDIERIGDHAENIVELAETKIEGKLPFSESALLELQEMFDEVIGAFKNAMEVFDQFLPELAHEVIDKEDEIDLMEKRLRKLHISRLNDGKCYPASGVLYLDILSNLERMADHSKDIAFSVLDRINNK